VYAQENWDSAHDSSGGMENHKTTAMKSAVHAGIKRGFTGSLKSTQTWKIPVLMKATSQKRSTSTTIKMDSVTRMTLRNRHLIQCAFPTSSHLQVPLTSARWS
jgi:hypothetical protein